MDNESREISRIAVVPLAIPVTIGPATIAVLLIQSAEITSLSFPAITALALALAAAVAALTMILLVSTWIEEKLGHNVIIVMSKLTGLILAAMASQMIFTGIKGFWSEM
jgi:multiple antibiotic resistance protein